MKIFSNIKRSSPLYCVSLLLQKFYSITIHPYINQKKGICLVTNILPKKIEFHKRLKKIVFIGGGRLKENGVPRDLHWKRINYVVFNSNFIKRIATRAFPVSSNCVIHAVGGVPADSNCLSPHLYKKLSYPLEFMICAKWWKRHFKRKPQLIHFFKEYIQKKYPGSILHVLGIKTDKVIFDKDNIYYYPKSFHKSTSLDVYLRSHIQLIFSPFDTGPLLLNESMHYRVPFICGNNSAAREYLNMIDGVCGKVVNIDPPIRNARDCKKFKPFTNKKFYGRALNYPEILKSVDDIIENYDKYTSWKWGELTYKKQAEKWMDILQSV